MLCNIGEPPRLVLTNPVILGEAMDPDPLSPRERDGVRAVDEPNCRWKRLGKTHALTPAGPSGPIPKFLAPPASRERISTSRNERNLIGRPAQRSVLRRR
jgi:hypothetical protein